MMRRAGAYTVIHSRRGVDLHAAPVLIRPRGPAVDDAARVQVRYSISRIAVGAHERPGAGHALSVQ